MSKRTIGRPSRIDDPEYYQAVCKRVRELGREGKSFSQISALIDVPKKTMLRWADKYEDFRTALARAKELEQAWWEDKGQESLTDKTFNANLWIKSMQARFKDEYTETRKQEVTGKDGKDLIPEGEMSLFETARGVAYLLRMGEIEMQEALETEKKRQ
jgi:hypothetical protein